MTRYVIIVVASTFRIRPKQAFLIVGLMQRIKQVVHHATRFNEAMSAVRGVPVTRAHITVGGYYDAL